MKTDPGSNKKWRNENMKEGDSLDDNDQIYEAEYDILVDKFETEAKMEGFGSGKEKGLKNLYRFDCESFDSDFSVRSNEYSKK